MKTKLATISALAIAILISAVFIFQKQVRDFIHPKEFSCRADLSIHTPSQLHFHGIMKIQAERGNGLILISGSYYHPDGSISELNRKIRFDYQSTGDILNMTSKEVVTLPSDTAKSIDLAASFQRFFYMPYITHSVELNAQGNGYIFSGSVIPFFYCEKQ